MTDIESTTRNGVTSDGFRTAGDEIKCNRIASAISSRTSDSDSPSV